MLGEISIKPIEVASYEVTLVEHYTKELKENLPSLEELEAEFGKENLNEKDSLKNGYNITKQKSKKSNSHEQFPKTKKHPKKMNLVTIEIAPNYPI